MPGPQEELRDLSVMLHVQLPSACLAGAVSGEHMVSQLAICSAPFRRLAP